MNTWYKKLSFGSFMPVMLRFVSEVGKYQRVPNVFPVRQRNHQRWCSATFIVITVFTL